MAEELRIEISGHGEEEEVEISQPSRSPFSDDSTELSEFLGNFPIQPLYTKPNDEDGLWCFWSPTESSQNYSSVDNRETPVHEKIKSALTKLKYCYGDGFAQFWVPVTRGGRRLLTTLGQPFAVTDLTTDLAQYRISSLNYLYDVDVISTEAQQADHNTLIVDGPPATAFLNHSPQLIYDLRPYSLKTHSYPSLASALEHGLIGYIVLPIFDPSTECCVGVLEYCMAEYDDFTLDVLHELFAAIKEADLITVDARESQPYDSDGLQRTGDEIEVALKTVCVSEKLDLAQAWIRYEYKNRVPFSSFMGHDSNEIDFMQNKQLLALVLVDYYDFMNDIDPNWLSVCIECDAVPFRTGEGLVGKTPQNHEPCLLKDISMLDKNKLSLPHTSGIKGSYFAICLRSTYTQNLDYVLEFFWTGSRDARMLLDSILFTLKRSLQSFKVVNGEEIGDNLCVKHISCYWGSNKCTVEDIDFSQKTNKISKRKYLTTPISLPRKLIEQQFGRTMLEAAKNLNVSMSTLKRKCKDVGFNEWQGPRPVHRKVSDSHRDRKDMNGNDIGAIQGPLAVSQDSIPDGTVLMIKAKYGGDIIIFLIPFSTTILQAVEEEISSSFTLKRGTYELKYSDEDNHLVTITCDKHFKNCVKSLRLLNSNTIRLYVEPIV